MSRFFAFVTILGAVLFLALISIRAPASLMANQLQRQIAGLSFSSVEGTLWNGSLQGVVIGSVELGRISYTLKPLSLLALGPQIDLELNGGAAEGTIALRASASKLTIKDAQLRLRLNGVTRSKVVGVPVTGTANIEISTLVLAQGRCLDGALVVSTDFMKVPARQWGGEGFVMAGPGQCQNGNIELNLAGQGTDGQARLVLTMRPDYSFAVDASVSPARREVSNALAVIGFEQRGSAMIYQTSGVLRNLAL